MRSNVTFQCRLGQQKLGVPGGVTSSPHHAHPDPHLNLLHTGHIYLIQTPTPTHLLSAPDFGCWSLQGAEPLWSSHCPGASGPHSRTLCHESKDRTGIRVSGFRVRVLNLAGQLETIEVCKVWPGGARTRIDRHDLVRKHVVRSPLGA